MLRSFLFLLLYGLAVSAAAGAALWLRRPIPARALASFALLPLLFLAPGVFGDRTLLPTDHALLILPWESATADVKNVERYNPNLNDAVAQFAPWAKAVRMAWKEGALPLRNRWNGCGMALAANGQSAAFAPWNLALFLIPLARAFTLLAAIKLLIALTGTWLWLRELRVQPIAAGFGAVAFSFSYTMTPWLLFPQTAAFCFFPWMLFAIERLRDREARNRAFAALLALFFVWPLAGHVETVASCALFGAVWLGARTLLRDFPRSAEVWGPLSLAALAALALSAFAVVPQVLAILESNRLVIARTPFWSGVFSWLPHGPVWPGAIVTLVPRLPGDGIASPMVPGAPASFPEMGLGHFGAIGAACAFLFLRPGSPRRPATWVLWLLVVSSLGAAVGSWPFAELVGHLPGAKLIFPIRWLSWVALAGSAIAALELDRFCRDLAARLATTAALWMALATTAAFAVAGFVGFRVYYASAGMTGPPKSALAATLAALGAAALAVGAAQHFRGRANAIALSLALSLAAELFFQGERLYRFGRAEKLFPETPLIAFLRSQPGVFRVIGEGTVLFPNSNVFAGLEDVRTHDPVERRDYVEFLDSCCGYDPTAYFKEIRDVDAPALDRLNVRYLISGPGRARPAAVKWKPVYSGRDGTVFENSNVFPRVFAAGGPAEAAVSDYREEANSASFRVEVRAARGETLIQSSLVEDGGWSARDERGRRIPTARSDGPFLSLRVPAGARTVRLRYRAPGLAAGTWVSLAMASLLFLTAVIRRIRFARRVAVGRG